jgi:hypoxanthine phosphoribosyltransferase
MKDTAISDARTRDLQRVLFTPEEIEARVRELAAEISRDYAGRELTVLGVLRGAFVFVADLMRAITIPCTVDFIAIESYGAATRSSGVVRLTKDLEENIAGKHVLIVEDIVDSGRTLQYLLQLMEARQAAGVAVRALLQKPSRHEHTVCVQYRGFSVPDEFVVGYGLDFNQQYRGLPCIGVLKPETYGAA